MIAKNAPRMNAAEDVRTGQGLPHLCSRFPWLPWHPFLKLQREKIELTISEAVAAADTADLSKLRETFELRRHRLKEAIETSYGVTGCEFEVAELDAEGPRVEMPPCPAELFWTDGRPTKLRKYVIGFQQLLIGRNRRGSWWAMKLGQRTKPGMKPLEVEMKGPFASDLEAVRCLLQWRLKDIFGMAIYDGGSCEYIPEIPLQCYRIYEEELGNLLAAQLQYKKSLQPLASAYAKCTSFARTDEELKTLIAIAHRVHDEYELSVNDLIDIELLLGWFSRGYAMLPMDLLAQRIWLNFGLKQTSKSIEKRCRRLDLHSLRMAHPKIADVDLFLGLPRPFLIYVMNRGQANKA
jgi:hypothetical protein